MAGQENNVKLKSEVYTYVKVLWILFRLKQEVTFFEYFFLKNNAWYRQR